MALASPPARADPFAIDYAYIFATHPDKTTRATLTERRLELPGPVLLSEHTTRTGLRYDAEDQSGYGAAGCLFDRTAQIVAMMQLCPDLLTPEQSPALSQRLLDIARFYARNTRPTIPDDRVIPALKTHLTNLRSQMTGRCPDPAIEQTDAVSFAHHLASPLGKRQIDRALSRPRLPVRGRCR